MMTRRNCSLHVVLSALAGAALVAVSAGICPASPAVKAHKLGGMVTAIEPALLTIDDGKQGGVTLHSREDYTEWVFPGTRVTAWYHEQAGILVLDRLEYPLEIAPVPPRDFIPGIHKVILLPSSNAGDARRLFDAIEGLLRKSFDWAISHRLLAEEIRRRHEKAHGARVIHAEPRDETTPEPLSPAGPLLIEKVASESRADAVLEVRVEYVLLKVKSHTAEWDGQRENFGSARSRFASAITMRPVRGEVSAATVAFKLHDPRGRLLWSRRRGFRLLAFQVGMEKNLRHRPLAESTEDNSFVDSWLEEVFASWLAVPAKSADATARR